MADEHLYDKPQFCLTASSSCLIKATAEQEEGVVYIHYLLKRTKNIAKSLIPRRWLSCLSRSRYIFSHISAFQKVKNFRQDCISNVKSLDPSQPTPDGELSAAVVARLTWVL